jgi:3-deoxy-D-manno-octulosonic-acid transferase
MRLIYTIGIWVYTLGIRVVALFGHEKARLMVNGWKRWPEEVAKLSHERPTAWFHAASLGEFEQARPVLEEYRRRHPDHQVLVTFFSPSGYEIRKNYALADAICYLPMDTPRNVRRFVFDADPDTVFFVKYEFWYNYLKALKGWGAKTYIFPTIFRPGQYFFKWYGGWFRKQLKKDFAHLFVQNEESLRLLQDHGIGQCSLAGDTRFDRVHQIALQAEGDKVVDCFLEGYTGQVLVCGSTWPPDEELLQATVNQENIKLILAPHVIAEEHLKQIEALFPDSIRYSQLNTEHLTQNTQSVLVIDNIGLLSKLYRYASVAYIGGGFGVGIHNILEAVTFGKPVLFGPNYHKFQEARDIIERGGGWSVGNAKELDCCLAPLLTDPDAHHRASQACTDYMQQNLGSTDIILSTIEK